MSQRGSLIALHTIQLVTFLGLTAVYPVQSVLYIGLLALVFAVMSYYVRAMTAFVSLIAGISFLGFFFVLQAWSGDAGLAAQGRSVVQHVLLGTLFTSTWLSSYFLRSMVNKYEAAVAELQQLQKYVGTPGYWDKSADGVLTANEFRYRLVEVHTSAERRHENTMVLWYRVRELKPRGLRRTIVTKLAQAAYASVRHDFDLVGVLGQDTVAVVLQNTDTHGAAIVEQRLREVVGDDVWQRISRALTLTHYSLGADWLTVERLVSEKVQVGGTRQGEAS